MVYYKQLLYRDLFLVHGPLPYLINALMIKLFSNHLNTFYSLGALSCYFILLTLYGVNRFIWTPFISFIITICIASLSFYSLATTASMLFPYAYAMLYSTLFSLMGAYGFGLWLKTGKPIFLYLVSLCLGLGTACKIDFILLDFVYLGYLLCLKNSFESKDFWKTYVGLNILYFIIPLLACLLALICTGVTFSDLLFWGAVFSDYIQSPQLKALYNVTGMSLGPETLSTLKLSLHDFIQTSRIFLIGSTFISSYLITFRVLKNKKPVSRTLLTLLSWCILSFLGALILPSLIQEMVTELLREGYRFSFLPLLSLILLLATIWRYRQVSKQQSTEQLLENKIVLSLLILGVCCSFRSFFSICLKQYGTYFIVLLMPGILVSLHFLLKTLNNPFQKYSNINWLKINDLNYGFLVTLLSICTTFLYQTGHYVQQLYVFSVSTPKGDFYGEANRAVIIKKAYELLVQLKPKTLLSIPEGVLLNYITDTPISHGYLYSLQPPHMQAYLHHGILNSLQQNSPDMVMVNTLTYPHYNINTTFVAQYPLIEAWLYQKYPKNGTLGQNQALSITYFNQH